MPLKNLVVFDYSRITTIKNHQNPYLRVTGKNEGTKVRLYRTDLKMNHNIQANLIELKIMSLSDKKAKTPKCQPFVNSSQKQTISE